MYLGFKRSRNLRKIGLGPSPEVPRVPITESRYSYDVFSIIMETSTPPEEYSGIFYLDTLVGRVLYKEDLLLFFDIDSLEYLSARGLEYPIKSEELEKFVYSICDNNLWYVNFLMKG